MHKIYLMIPVLALAACSEPASNQASDKIEVTGQSTGSTPQPAPAETTGQDFVSAVLGGYGFSIESARLAEQKAATPSVKQYAAKLRADLEASQKDLSRIASSAGLRLEPSRGETHETDLAVLSSTSGAALERPFAEQQLEALTQLVGLIRAYKNGGDNPALKAWAETAQAVVNDRLLDVQTLNAELLEAAER